MQYATPFRQFVASSTIILLWLSLSGSGCHNNLVDPIPVVDSTIDPPIPSDYLDSLDRNSLDDFVVQLMHPKGGAIQGTVRTKLDVAIAEARNLIALHVGYTHGAKNPEKVNDDREGCPPKDPEEKKYGVIDCSGLVAWVLKKAGFGDAPEG